MSDNLPLFIPIVLVYLSSLTSSPAVRGPAASRSAEVEGHADSGDSRHAAGPPLHCWGTATCSWYFKTRLHTVGDTCTVPVRPLDCQHFLLAASRWDSSLDFWSLAPRLLSFFFWLTLDASTSGKRNKVLKKKSMGIREATSHITLCYNLVVFPGTAHIKGFVP